MRNVFIVRHGESEHHLNGMTGGWTNSELTERGRSQANLTGKKLNKHIEMNNLTAADFELLSSDLDRAFTTAKIIGDIIGIDVKEFVSLREFNNGIAADMRQEEAEKIITEISKPMLDWRPFKESETWRELLRRIMYFFNNFETEKPGAYHLKNKRYLSFGVTDRHIRWRRT